MFDKNKIDLVFYHGSSCIDGLASTSVVKYYYEKKDLDLPVFVACRHGEKIEIYCKNKTVLIVDFYFDIETTKKIISETEGNFLNIDHHENSRIQLENISKEYKIFDNDHCGATLTWNYFFPKKPFPKLLNYVEDYDIWNLKSPLRWKEMNLILNDLLTNIYNKVDDFYNIFIESMNNEKFIDKLLKKGKTIKEFNDSIIEKSLSRTTLAVLKDPLNKDNFILVSFCNTTSLTNEIADNLIEKFPQIDLILNYSVPFINLTKFYARSNGKYSTNLFSNLYQGGGHVKASGFQIEGTIPFEILEKFPLSDIIPHNGESKSLHFSGNIGRFLQNKFGDKIILGRFIRKSNEEFEKIKKEKFLILQEIIEINEQISFYVDKEYYNFKVIKVEGTKVEIEEND